MLTIYVVLQHRGLEGEAHLIEHYSESPHVDFRPYYAVVLLDFWRNVAESAASNFHQSFAVRLLAEVA